MLHLDHGTGMKNIIPEETDKSYYLNLREFASGEFEAVLKVVRPMQSEMMEASMNGSLTNTAWMHIKPAAKEEENPEAKAQQNYNRAVRRAKQNIRWLCKAMDADRLFTLTYREDQNDREQARADFTRFLRLVRSGWRGEVGVPNWQYVAVLEKQQRGAFHIHCAVKGFQRIKFLRKCWYKALACDPDVSGEHTPGSVNVTNPDKSRWGHTGRQWKVNKLAGYLTKYLTKTFDETATEKRRYWHCKDVIQPKKQRFWVTGNTMLEAIKSTVELLSFHVGLGNTFTHWLSIQNDSYWIAGSGKVH